MIPMKPMPSPLSPELQAALARVLGRRADHGLAAPDLDRIVDLLGEVPPERITTADAAIAYAAGLHREPPPSRWRWFGKPRTDAELLAQSPDLALLFLFHRDGRMREAALARLSGGLPSPFLFAAVAWRLNDWSAPVRTAAVACARRCFPLTPPEVVARCAAALHLQRLGWSRWSGERAVLDEAFGRPDVAARLADLLIGQMTGPVARVLRAVSRTPALDPYLLRVAAEAVQPAARAAALSLLVEGKASWPVGRDWQWVDKSIGRRRLVFVYDVRPLTVAPGLDTVIAQSIADRSAAVRRVALEGAMYRLKGRPEARTYATRLLGDRSPSVRERAEFILRTDTGEASRAPESEGGRG
ncbi:hypothetical protein [Methylobacterium sp. Leaf106]|uniref:hypothetical protein n=1 Tax=Methylobacterium sp. Leaf106 TaxID=1736255 RepID=UPI0006F82D34|nr:hypothetical protein [Methylobacterium sp. Leaf106]KQP40158.1 hypothetical protein ASF34_12665 [Methylobacterium sp. Leaf106]